MRVSHRTGYPAEAETTHPRKKKEMRGERRLRNLSPHDEPKSYKYSLGNEIDATQRRGHRICL